MASYSTSDFRKGLKVQIDGEPYQMTECQFVKPGKGNALYECTLKNLIRGTTLKKVYRGGDELESADVEEVPCQYLYKQGETYVFMNTKTYDQYELTKEQVDEEGHDAHFFDDFESGDEHDNGDASGVRELRKPKKPARQRVELRHEQQTLRRQLSDWDDYGQDDFDTKL